MRRFVVIAVLLAASAFVTAAGRPPDASKCRPDVQVWRSLTCQLGRSSSGLPVVVLQVEGHRLRFGIDTGTTRTLVSGEVADRLGLIPHRRLSIGGAAAGVSRDAFCGRGLQLRLDDIPIPLDCLGWIPQERRLAGTEDLDGLLGSDALAHFDLWIDLRDRHVKARFAPPGTLATHTDGRRIHLAKTGSRPVVAARLAGAGLPADEARFVLDSGANGLVLFGELARKTAAAARHTVVSGRIESPTATRVVPIIPVGGVRVEGSLYSLKWAGLLPDVTDRAEDGLLPLDALGPVLIDFSNRLVVAGARVRTR